MNPLGESVAIILGAAAWPGHDGLDPHECFSNSATWFRDYLLHRGLPQANLLWLFDNPQQPGMLDCTIRMFLRKAATDAIRNVLFYYVGHGNYRDPKRNRDYFIAPRCTSRDNLELTTLAVRHVARTLGQETPDKRHIVIIDACYAAGAVRDFILQDSGELLKDIDQQLREHLPHNDIEHGTSVFCAAGPKIRAWAPEEAQYTMFSGALRDALTMGDPKAGPFLSLERLAELVEASIRAAFGAEGVRPELHTPRQEKGDIRNMPLFPNPAARPEADPARLREMAAEIETLRHRLGPFGRELAWIERSRVSGWYELLELRKEIDQFGDVVQCHRVCRIHGPEKGRIETLPYGFRATPKLGTCVLHRITDEQQGWSRVGAELPPPNEVLTGDVRLNPPATAQAVHAGFTIASRIINSFAMTPLDADQRGHAPVEDTTIRAAYPAQILRLAVFFPRGYQPAEMRVVARCPTDVDLPVSKWPEDAEETARVAPYLFFDRDRGCAMLTVERSFPEHHYVLSWRLPTPPEPPWAEMIQARDQVRVLLNLGAREREAVEAMLSSIRDEVCRTSFRCPPRRKPNMHLSLLAFDEAAAVTRVVCTTMDGAGRDVTFPRGAGVVGWVMRRRRPAFVDTRDSHTYGIYRTAEGVAQERHLLCVPLPLPSDSDRRSELLLNPAMPCLVTALSCVDDSGNMGLLKEPAGSTGVSSKGLLAAVSSDLAGKLLDLVSRETLS